MPETLSKKELDQFDLHGFVRIENAFSQEIANAALDILWNDLPCDRYDSSTWTEPVIRLGMYPQQPFVDSLNSTRMHLIFDQLIGKNKWFPCTSVGTFPVRFPSAQQPNDTGKHVDVSFPGNDPNNYFEWRSNIKSKGRALLMLVLYSDVSENDAPTVIYQGSHIDVAKLLAKADDYGLSFMELAEKVNDLPERKQVYATGKAGTVYLWLNRHYYRKENYLFQMLLEITRRLNRQFGNSKLYCCLTRPNSTRNQLLRLIPNLSKKASLYTSPIGISSSSRYMV